MYTTPAYLTTNASRAAVEDMNIHLRCLDITVAAGEILPSSLFRGVAEATLSYTYRTIYMLPPSSLFSPRDGG
mgnify:CR=1 FL=1